MPRKPSPAKPGAKKTSEPPKFRHHLGVYGLIRNHEGDILCIEKARGPYKGLFDLPGGTMEDGELLEETLTREILEETACKVKSFSQLGAISLTYPYVREGEPVVFRHVAILYTCTVTGTPRRDADGEDADGTHWISPTPGALARHCSPLVAAALKLEANLKARAPKGAPRSVKKTS